MATKDGKKTGGRKKGTPNKKTAEVKQALSEAFELMGGVPSLVLWARENETEFYKLWSKLLPVQTASADSQQVSEQVTKIEIVGIDSKK